jgi:hypothetical protein
VSPPSSGSSARSRVTPSGRHNRHKGTRHRSSRRGGRRTGHPDDRGSSPSSSVSPCPGPPIDRSAHRCPHSRQPATPAGAVSLMRLPAGHSPYPRETQPVRRKSLQGDNAPDAARAS